MAKILVVDDNVLDQRLAGACIAELGSDSVYAGHGQEALAVLEREAVDVVVTDLQMPEMDGLELVQQVCRRFPNVPVILMTANGSEEIAVRALRAGAASYVPKASLKQDLGEALRSVLAAVNAIRQRDKVRQFLEASESRFVMGYEPGAQEALVGYLQDELTRLNFCNPSGMLQISTALMESLTNAIEHGNLELESEWREAPNNLYHTMGQTRSREAPYCHRRVFLTARVTPGEATYVVRDEGPGFDPATLADPTDPENLLKPSGRGVMLIHTFMDEVRFNDQGNEITMIKRRKEA